MNELLDQAASLLDMPLGGYHAVDDMEILLHRVAYLNQSADQSAKKALETNSDGAPQTKREYIQ